MGCSGALPHEFLSIQDIRLTCCYSRHLDWGKFSSPHQKETKKESTALYPGRQEVKSALTAFESTAKGCWLVDGLLIYIVIN